MTDRAGVFVVCLVISHVAAWFHYPVTTIGAVLIALFAVTAVFRKLRGDQSVTRALEGTARIAPIGTLSPHVAAACANARVYHRRRLFREGTKQ